MSELTGYDKFIQQAIKYGFSLFGTAKTGQTIVYIAGDDGTYQAGYPKTGAHYIDNGDGTITDMASGLMWTKKISDLGAAWWSGGAAIPRIWATALSQCAALTYAGYSDWRLPNTKEMFTIIDFGQYNPAFDPIFEEPDIATYWTSTTQLNAPTYAFGIVGLLGTIQNKLKSQSGHVRPVRGGIPT